MMLRKTPVRMLDTAPDHQASMRPQHDAAENAWIHGSLGLIPGASMRPQHDAAENLGEANTLKNMQVRFNEAAA